MDWAVLISELRHRHKKIEDAIYVLEDYLASSHPSAILTLDFDEQLRPKRGRLNMGERERLDVSVRMKNYWARRREGLGLRTGL